MDERRQRIVAEVARYTVAFALTWAGAKLLFGAGGGFGAVGPLLLGMAAWVLAALLIAGPLAERLTAGTGRLFWPGDRYDKPQPVYGIPQARRAEGKYEEALAGYAKLVTEHPNEIRAFSCMFEIVLLDLGDRPRADEILAWGLAACPDDESRASLQRGFDAIASRMAPDPEWLTEQRERPLRTNPSDPDPVEEPDGLAKKRYHAGGKAQPFEGTRPPLPFRKADTERPQEDPGQS